MRRRFSFGVVDRCFVTQRVIFCSLAFFPSHCFTASSMAVLRSPFFPPNTVTTASLSLLSVSSDRTIYILPKVRHHKWKYYAYSSLHISAVLQSRALILFRTSRSNFGLSFGSLICCRSERTVVPIRFVTLQLFSAYVSVTVDVDVSRFPIGRQSSVWMPFRTPDIFEPSS